MRINFGRQLRGHAGAFVIQTILQFAEEYAMGSARDARDYVTRGKQGLRAYAEWLAAQGYKVDVYWLEPNKDLFVNVGENYGDIIRTSPSYGLVIAEDCPRWVEFKLKN